MSKPRKNSESNKATTIDFKATAGDGKPGRTDSDPILLARVLAEEFEEITGKAIVGEPDVALTVDGVVSTEPSLDSVFEQFHAANLKALCFSGGGIRSATFGLGIAQKLAERGLLDDFHYLSTVSGGGYMGSWLSAWVRRERVKAATDPTLDVRGVPLEERPKYREPFSAEKNIINGAGPHSETGIKAVQEQINCIRNTSTEFPTPEADPLRHLREYSNYMSPRVGLLSADTWTLIGIYLRNLFLNWTIFIPLIAAVLLLPRLVFAVLISDRVRGLNAVAVLLAGLVLGSIAIGFVVDKLPSKNATRADPDHNKDAWVLAFGVVPLILMAFASAGVWAWKIRYPGVGEYFDFLPAIFNRPVSYFILGGLALYSVGYLIFLFKRGFRGLKFNLSSLLAGAASGAVGGILLWLAANRVFNSEKLDAAISADSGSYYLQVYLCFAVPVFLLVFLLAATIFVGLSSRTSTDEDREWMARYGAWILIVSGVWIVLNGLVLFGPSGLEYLTKFRWTWEDGWPPLVVSVISVVSGFLSLVGGFSEKALVRNEPVKSRVSQFLAHAPKIAAPVFLIFIFVALAYATTVAVYSLGAVLTKVGVPPWLLPLPASSEHFVVLSGTSSVFLLLWLVSFSSVGIGMACFVNVNKFSLHGAYRDRLIRAYLGASNFFRRRNSFTGFDDADNFQLHRLRGQRPFHVINATLNLVRGKNLAWQNRKAASFTMSPLHCGSWLLGYRNTNEYCRNTNLGDCKSREFCNRKGNPCKPDEKCELPGRAIRLGTAMAISGAAANPNMGYISSPIVTFLMSLFNIRLGWWLGNTGDAGSGRDWFGWGKSRFFEKASPSIAVFPLINETLGRTDEDKRFVMVTDGGHFENLGLYEMILRRCKFIVLSDGAADRTFKFGEISNAIQKCKVDLGVDIKFNDGIKIVSRVSKAKKKKEAARFAIADITYPEKDDNGNNLTGCLLYMRPAYYEDEYTDIKHYADANPGFPHQSTGDQMYDEKQFEAYRGLGFFTMDRIIGNKTYTDLDQLMENLCGSSKSKDKTKGSSPQPLPELLGAK